MVLGAAVSQTPLIRLCKNLSTPVLKLLNRSTEEKCLGAFPNMIKIVGDMQVLMPPSLLTLGIEEKTS